MSSIISASSKKRESQPIELSIYNYPASKPDLEKIKGLVLDRLTIAASKIDNALLNILDGLTFKNLTVEACSMTENAGEILAFSPKEQAIFHRCFVSKEYFASIGILKIGNEYAFFHPQARELAQKKSLIPQALRKALDAPETGPLKIFFEETEQHKYQNKFEKLKSIAAAYLREILILNRINHQRILKATENTLPVYHTYVNNFSQLGKNGKSLSKIILEARTPGFKIDQAYLQKISDLNDTVENQINVCKLQRTVLESIDAAISIMHQNGMTTQT